MNNIKTMSVHLKKTDRIEESIYEEDPSLFIFHKIREKMKIIEEDLPFLMKHLKWDLSHHDLANSDFSGLNLSFIDFSHANLINANLSNCHLNGASLVNADLTGANLENTCLVGCKLKGANLENANLKNVCFDLYDYVVKDIKN